MSSWTAGEVVDGRWRLLARVPGADAVERWRVAADDDGTPAEILALSAPAADAAARAAFHDLHRGVSRASDPATVRVFGTGLDAERAWVVRGPLEDATLADVPGPVPCETAAWVGATLVPAVLAAGGATRGVLLPSDVGVDAGGGPMLAPRGAPANRVALGSARSAAPEVLAGGKPDGAAGLYGVGVLLYRLATGREPLGRSDGPPPPPPSAVRHGIPDTFDQAVLRLLSRDPGARAGALPVLQELAKAADLRSHTRKAPTAVPIVTSTAVATPDRAAGGYVVLPAATLRGLGPDERSQAAGLARVPVRWIDTLVADGLPLVVATAPGAGAARRSAERIRQETGLPVAGAVPIGLGAVLAFGAAQMIALLLLLVLFAVGLGSAGLLAALLGVTFALTGTWLGLRGRQAGLAVRSYEHTRVHLVEQRAGGLLSAAWERVADVRVQLASADLPAPAASDLRDALKDAELRLEDLARLGAAADSALRGLDEGGLRTRLATLQTRASDPATAAERDRLARTVADLDAVRGRRATVSEGATEVLDRLAAAAAALGQIGTADTDEPDLVRVERSAARLRAPAVDRERES